MKVHDGLLGRWHRTICISLASGVVLGVSVAGCAKGPQISASLPSASPTAPTAAPAPGATPFVVDEPAAAKPPFSALVRDAGKPGAPVLDPAAKAELDRIVAKVPEKKRPLLRYALASDTTGKVHLVVYDGLGLPANGKPRGKFEYIVFKPLNATDGSTYDPTQNAIDEPVPPPPERASLDAIKTN